MPAIQMPHDSATWLDRPELLTSKLADWAGQALVALDTEFIRERTYWPRLALVQLAVPGDVVLVDILVPGMPQALVPLLANPAVTKLMHSAGEDLQALKTGCGTLPEPLYDTQVAAALAGLGASLSYQKLVEQVTGVALPKGETRSDWMQRPLSASQRAYAADDVRYLHAIHAELDPRLRQLDRRDWLRADCERALDQVRRDEGDPWPHLALRSAQFLDGEAQARLCRLLRWREVQARESDKPRSWILDNELAVALARTPPMDRRAFDALLDQHPKAPRRLRGALWDVLGTPLTPAERDIPLAAAQEGDYKQRLRRLQDAVAERTAQLGLPEGILASRRSLESLLGGRGWPDALRGWRREILEPVLEPLL